MQLLNLAGAVLILAPLIGAISTSTQWITATKTITIKNPSQTATPVVPTYASSSSSSSSTEVQADDYSSTCTTTSTASMTVTSYTPAQPTLSASYMMPNGTSPQISMPSAPSAPIGGTPSPVEPAPNAAGNTTVASSTAPKTAQFTGAASRMQLSQALGLAGIVVAVAGFMA